MSGGNVVFIFVACSLSSVDIFQMLEVYYIHLHVIFANVNSIVYMYCL
jgi:hypothetical protein